MRKGAESIAESGSSPTLKDSDLPNGVVDVHFERITPQEVEHRKLLLMAPVYKQYITARLTQLGYDELAVGDWWRRPNAAVDGHPPGDTWPEAAVTLLGSLGINDDVTLEVPSTQTDVA